MQRSDFHFDLPSELIAQHPVAERSGSRLLCLDGSRGQIQDKQFIDFPDVLQSGDLLVFNDTRVIPARLFGCKESGGRVEVLVERLLDEQRVVAHVRASKSPRAGSRLLLEEHFQVEVVGRQGELFELLFPGNAIELLEAWGRMPLPPYIERQAEAADAERYQTVFSDLDKKGAVAAPTAGLHFDQVMLDKIKAQGIATARVTLHVGAGTFQPVRVDDLGDHHMHSEYLEVSEEACAAIEQTRLRGGRVIAVGTTVVRSLESAARNGKLAPFSGETNIFIHPGYQFQVVDAMLTNFHLPESTLLMLVSAFAGYDEAMNAYAHAIEQQYRFFSYGDAMFVLPKVKEER